MPDTGDVALACASLLVDELVRAGVRHACLTPGSRSTPLALALGRHDGLTLHVHVDERASSYFALGIARATGEPVVAACSSGTAAANHLPAVVEASMSALPLIVLTADRPPELHDTGANQTIDQTALFGRFVRWFADTGVPVPGNTAARYWRSLGSRAATRAAGPPPGPVHLNLPFREPLVPLGVAPSLGEATEGRPDGEAWHRVVTPRARPEPADVDTICTLVQRSSRVAVVAGTARRAPVAFARLCAERGWPLLAEPTSNVRVPEWALAAGELLVADRDFRSSSLPELVIQLGSTPTTRAMQAVTADATTLVIVDPEGADPDPARRAQVTLRCEPDDLAPALREAAPGHADDGWRDAWTEADGAVRAAVDELLDGWDEPFEGRVARDIASLAPFAATMFAGSSMPVRDLAAYMAPRQALRVVANRGASGIDGSVASALGIASVTQPALALIGDLALLHDASALLWSARHDAHLVLVVVDNDGGGIFSLLPQAALDIEEFERLFGTPHGERLDVGALAAAAGAGYALVGTASELPAAVSAAQGGRGVHLVHVRVDRARAPELRAAVAQRVRSVLGGLSAPRAPAASPRT